LFRSSVPAPGSVVTGRTITSATSIPTQTTSGWGVGDMRAPFYSTRCFRLKPTASRADLVVIVAITPDFPWHRLGELLLERGLVDERELVEALAVQSSSGRRLGEILVTRGSLAAPDLIAVLAEQHGLDVRVEERAPNTAGSPARPPAGWQPLGRILVERGSLGRAALRTAVAEQRRTGARLGSILVDGGHVSAVELVEALVQQHGLEPHALVAAAPVEAGSGGACEVVAGDCRALFRTAGFLDGTDLAFGLLEAD